MQIVSQYEITLSKLSCNRRIDADGTSITVRHDLHYQYTLLVWQGINGVYQD